MLWWTLRKLKSKSPDSRLKAVVALENHHDKRTINALVSALFDDEGRVRWAAVCALKCRNWQPAANEPPVSAITDPGKREYALQALAELSWRAPTPELRAVLAVMRKHYSDAVGEGSSAIEPLVQHVRYGQAAAGQALAEIADPRAVEPISRLLGDRNDEVRLSAVKALKNLGATDTLLGALDNDRLPVRLSAIEALKKSNDERVIRRLFQLAETDRLMPIRDSAFRALSETGSQLADSLLRPLLENNFQRWMSSGELWVWLNEHNSEGLEQLCSHLKRSSYWPLDTCRVSRVLETAQCLLTQTKSVGIDELRELLSLANKKPAGKVQFAVSQALKEMRAADKDCIELAAETLLSHNNDAGGVSSLLHNSGTDAIESVKTAFRARDIANVNCWAMATFLKSIGPPESSDIDLWLRLFDSCVHYAANAFAHIGDPRGIPPLVTYLDKARNGLPADSYGDADAAVKALQQLLDKHVATVRSEVLRPVLNFYKIRFIRPDGYDYHEIDLAPLSRVAEKELLRRGKIRFDGSWISSS